MISPYFHIISRHTAQLETMGYSQRIPMAAHFYALSFIFILLGGVGAVLMSYPILVTGWVNAAKKGRENPRFVKVKTWMPYFLYALFFGGCALLSNLISVEDSGRRAWNVHVSYFPYFWLTLFTWALPILSYCSYVGFLALRHRAWERLNNRSVSVFVRP